MTVRMVDVARRAGVSAATVSLALSGSPRISTSTRERVTTIARQLGYQPHAGARSLRTELTRSVGLIISDVANPFFAELAGEIQRAAAHAGFSIVLCNSDEDPDRQDEYLAGLLAGSQVDGVILVPTDAMTPGLRAAGAARARLVLLDRPVAVSGRGASIAHLAHCPVVRSDAAQALDEAAELLTTLGHDRIGIIAPPLQTQIGQERRDLFRDSLVRRGVARRDVAVVEGDFRQDSGARAVDELLARRRPPTAVFAADGLMAIGALQGLREAGLRVPYDISVVGFDDAPWFDLFDPPLTAIAQPIASLAEAAVTAMLACISGAPAKGARPACSLVRRSSCGLRPERSAAGRSVTHVAPRPGVSTVGSVPSTRKQTSPARRSRSERTPQ